MGFPCKGPQSDKAMNDMLMGQRTDKEYNVCLQGASLDVGNKGCCALAASFIKLVNDTKPNAKIYLLYANRTNGVQRLELSDQTIEVNIVNFRLSPKARINEQLFYILLMAIVQRIMPLKWLRAKIIQSNRWLRTLESANFVGEIRGGDSFSDIYGLRRFLIGTVPSIIAILMRKKLVLLPQTFGPFKWILSKHVARLVMTRASQLFSRDPDSIELVWDMLGEKGKHKDIQLCPDVAFILDPILPDKPDIQPELDRKSNIPLIGLNISTLLYIGGFTRNNMFGLKVDYKELIRTLFKELMKRTRAHVLLIPHEYFPFMIDGQEFTEIEVCKEVRQLIDKHHRDRIHLVMREYDQNHIKGIIGICDFFIGSRMHACIAALSQCVPAVGLAYSKKFQGVFQSVGAEQFAVDMRQKDTQEIIETVISAYEQRDSIAGNLKATIPETQKQIRNVFREMLCETRD